MVTSDAYKLAKQYFNEGLNSQQVAARLEENGLSHTAAKSLAEQILNEEIETEMAAETYKRDFLYGGIATVVGLVGFLLPLLLSYNEADAEKMGLFRRLKFVTIMGVVFLWKGFQKRRRAKNA